MNDRLLDSSHVSQSELSEEGLEQQINKYAQQGATFINFNKFREATKDMPGDTQVDKLLKSFTDIQSKINPPKKAA